MFRKDFIVRKNNLLTRNECHKIIDWIFLNKINFENRNIEITGYEYCDISFDELFQTDDLKKLKDSIIHLKDSYIEEYPEVDNTPVPWKLDYVRFKWWKPGKSFSGWHSDHGGDDRSCLDRMLAFMIYLSDNDCSTEFKRYRNAKTKSGSAIMFPTFFTHEHRGGVCKKGKDRFVISGYYSFI